MNLTNAVTDAGGTTNLEPIAGVDLAVYAQVSRGIAAYGYDATKLSLVAAGLGVSAEDWAAAQAGWATRIQTDRVVGVAFNELYSAFPAPTQITPTHTA